MHDLGALTVFTAYFLLIVVLFGVILRDLKSLWSCVDSQAKRAVFPSAALTLASFAHTWFYMFKFMEWSFKNHRSKLPASTDTSLERLASWLVHTQLFEQAWTAVCFPDSNWWWSEQLCLFTVGFWTVFLAFEGNKWRVKHVWAYMLLGQIVAISVASNLFYTALILSKARSANHKAETRSASPLLWTCVLLSLATIAIVPMTSERTFLPNLLVMHGLILLPLLSSRQKGPGLFSMSPKTLYSICALFSLVLRVKSLRILFTQSPKHLWVTLHAHPAQSSIGWDVIWTTFSFAYWASLDTPRSLLSLATLPFVSVAVVAPYVLDKEPCFHDLACGPARAQEDARKRNTRTGSAHGSTEYRRIVLPVFMVLAHVVCKHSDMDFRSPSPATARSPHTCGLFCVGCGFAITRAGIFPQIAARGAGQIMLNIALPCLMFSKIVTAFSDDNTDALGPLVLLGFIYGALGILMAWMIRAFFWVPHRFRYGILVAGGWSNYGDIPTSVIMSITASPPFGGANDQNLSVAYISVLLLVFLVTFFPLGGHRWIAMDFDGPDVENEEIRASIRHRRSTIFSGWHLALSILRRSAAANKDKESAGDPDSFNPRQDDEKVGYEAPPGEIIQGNATSPESTIETQMTSSSTIANAPTKRVFSRFKTALLHMLTPPSLSIFTSFPIALVPQLKALFVEVNGIHIPAAPDGQPPLAFIMDATTFVGAASVPVGLICLGSALARMRVPRHQWQNLPLGAILSLAVGKMILSPVLGVLFTNALVRGGLISAEDRVLRFVCIFFSCLPTATTQVYVTQAYSKSGSAEHIPPFLIPQYLLMFISMTALNAYTLRALF